MLPYGMSCKNEDAEESVLIFNKIKSVPEITTELAKRELEDVQIEAYRQCVANERPDENFEVVFECEAPDYFIKTRVGTIGIDVAAFAFPQKKAADSEFKSIKDYLSTEYDNGRLRQCEGWRFVLKFNSAKVPQIKTNKFLKPAVKLH